MPLAPMRLPVLVLLAAALAGCGGGAGGDGAVAQAADPATENLKVAQGLARPPAKRYLLSVAAGARGTVTSSPAGIDCGAGHQACQARYGSGSTVTLSAAPVNGYKFAGWTGACIASAGPLCSVQIANADVATAAQFVAAPQHTVALSWTASTEASVTGYIVHHGTQPGVYTDTMRVASPSANYNTTATGTHYFAVNAADAAGNESPRSSEVSVSIP